MKIAKCENALSEAERGVKIKRLGLICRPNMDPRKIEIADFQYELPEHQIAQHPLEERSESKLLVWENDTIDDRTYREVSQILPKNAMLILNNTRVVPVRLIFKNQHGARIEIFCLEPIGHQTPQAGMIQCGQVEWKCLVGRKAKWKEPYLTLQTTDCKIMARIKESKDDTTHIAFEWEPTHLSFAEILKLIGEMPIPPYLKRESNKQDETRYQSVFASEDGSVAAPTASLHFTDQLLSHIQQKGCDIHYLTLHVGAGTFKPVKSETIGEHAMHAEWMEIQLEFIESILKSVTDGRPVYCVGTTSLRTLESIYWMGVKCIENPDILITELPVQQWEAYELPQNHTVIEALQALIDKMKSVNQEQLVCQTAILITPVYQCRMIQGIFTNFHQPASTLLLLVASITGLQWKKIYTHALQNEYRFLSYGDGCLLHVPKAE